MTQIEEFISRCDAVAVALGITRPALSNRLLFDSRRLDLIALGEVDIGVMRLQQAQEDLKVIAAGGQIESPRARKRAAA